MSDYLTAAMAELTGTAGQPGWDEVGMMQAVAIAHRSVCARTRQGCVIVRDRRSVSQGYNGSLSGSLRPCCTSSDIPCTTAVHAEQNAIYWAAAEGIPLRGSTAYTTTSPCVQCARGLKQAGIVRVVFLNYYRDTSGLDELDAAGVDYYQLPRELVEW